MGETGRVQLTKHHGLGNDFLVVLGAADGALAPERLGALARRLCDRHRGIGADGLILGEPGSGASDGDDTPVDVVMHLYNADGSRAEMSGNGVRCLAQAVAAAGWTSAADGANRVVAATDAGLRTLELREGTAPDEVLVSVTMGTVGPGPQVPVAVRDLVDDELGDVRLATADVGNPHLVIEVDDPVAVDLRRLGPLLEAAFPGGINVQLVRGTDDGALLLHVWERGVGLTQACGTGACAAAQVARSWGLADERVRVHMPGGAAQVLLDGDQATLTGPAVFIGQVEVPAPEPARV